MLEPYALNIALEILKIIGGVLVPLLTIGITIYAKKLEDKMKRKAVEDEINRLTLWGEQTPYFGSMSKEDKIETILETVSLYIMENGITMSEAELRIMIERSMLAPRKLMTAGMKLGLIKKEK